jgi:3-hydroxybutyryl-CoA dehydratase
MDVFVIRTGSRLLQRRNTSNDCSDNGEAGWAPWTRLARLLPFKRLIQHPNEPALESPTELRALRKTRQEAVSPADEPLYMEDMKVGDRWSSPWREISADDVAEFARLTGDHDPLHSDVDSSSPFGEPVAHGLLGLSVLAGLSTEHPRVATLALIGISDWKFEAPVFFGESVQVVTEIESIEKHGRRSARIVWLRKLVNQNGSVVQQGRFVSLVASRARARRLSGEPPTQRGTLPAR